MTKYFTLANAITVSRLFIFFGSLWFLAMGESTLAIVLFAIAWGLDAIDGLVARLMGEVSEFGSQLDKVIDRIIVGIGLLAFIRLGLLPRAAILLITKDIALAPAITILAARDEPDPGLGRLGKTVTLLQGVAIIWLALGYGVEYQAYVIGFVAVVGFLAAFLHLRRIV